jgi:hypothetical protein
MIDFYHESDVWFLLNDLGGKVQPDAGLLR